MTNITLTNCAAKEYHILQDPLTKNQFISLESNIYMVFRTIFNFDTQWILPESGTWGVQNKTNGQWNGCVRELEMGRADISSAGLTVTIERLEVQ